MGSNVKDVILGKPDTAATNTSSLCGTNSNVTHAKSLVGTSSVSITQASSTNNNLSRISLPSHTPHPVSEAMFETVYPEMIDFIEDVVKHLDARITRKQQIQYQEFQKETLHVLKTITIPAMICIIPRTVGWQRRVSEQTAENIYSKFCVAEKSLIHVQNILCNALIGKYGKIKQGNLDMGPARQIVRCIQKRVSIIVDKMRNVSHNYQMDKMAFLIQQSSNRPDPIRATYTFSSHSS